MKGKPARSVQNNQKMNKLLTKVNVYVQEYRFSMILTSLDAKRLHLMTATTILESGGGGGKGMREAGGEKERDFFDKKNSALKFASEVF